VHRRVRSLQLPNPIRGTTEREQDRCILRLGEIVQCRELWAGAEHNAESVHVEGEEDESCKC
jgi:hypothetical protein